MRCSYYSAMNNNELCYPNFGPNYINSDLAVTLLVQATQADFDFDVNLLF